MIWLKLTFIEFLGIYRELWDEVITKCSHPQIFENIIKYYNIFYKCTY